MSLVARGTTTTDPEDVLDHPDGGVFVGTFDTSALGAVTFTVEAYTQVNQGSPEVLHSSWSIAGAAPTDPAALIVGPIISAYPVRMVASGATAIPYQIESVGQVSTVENGEGLIDATGSADTLVEVPYAGTFYLLVDVAIMAGGDDVKLRLDAYIDGAYQTALYSLFEDAQTDLIATLGPITVSEKVRGSLDHSAGAVEDFYWCLVRLG